jgi:tRNA threonylcarbamoyladenosine biosynthesis protein TsaE
MKEHFITNSEAETLDVARCIGKSLGAGTVVALSGELGAGKTVFAQGIAESLEVREQITSPTFTLINEYRGRLPLFHMDLYRLDSTGEIEDIGIVDYLYGDGVCVIEWAEKLGKLMPENAVAVSLSPKGKGCREIRIERNDNP